MGPLDLEFADGRSERLTGIMPAAILHCDTPRLDKRLPHVARKVGGNADTLQRSIALAFRFWPNLQGPLLL